MRLSPVLLACLALLAVVPAASAAKPDVPPGQAKEKATPPGQAKDKPTPPGQAKDKPTPPGLAKEPGAPAAPAAGGADEMLQRPTTPADPTLSQLGQTVGAVPVGGPIKVKLPGADEFTALPDDAPLPLGTVVDATEGLVQIGSEAADGGEQNVVMTGALFRISQDASGTTDLALKGGDFDACDAPGAPGRARAAAARKGKGDVVRGLWAAGHGKFRTKGRYGTAAVRGTRWATVDRCGSTTIKVFDGIVDVTDLLTGTTAPVRAGQKRVIRAAAR